MTYNQDFLNNNNLALNKHPLSPHTELVLSLTIAGRAGPPLGLSEDLLQTKACTVGMGVYTRPIVIHEYVK